MGRKCTVCSHPQREEIDKEIVGNTATYRDIAKRFHVQKDAVFRHVAHIPPQIVKAKGEELIAWADGLLGEWEELRGDIKILKTKAQKAESWDQILDALKLQHDLLKSRTAVAVQMEKAKLESGAVLDFRQSEEWKSLRSVVLNAVKRFPKEVEDAIVEALESYRGGSVREELRPEVAALIDGILEQSPEEIAEREAYQAQMRRKLGIRTPADEEAGVRHEVAPQDNLPRRALPPLRAPLQMRCVHPTWLNGQHWDPGQVWVEGVSPGPPPAPGDSAWLVHHAPYDEPELPTELGETED